MATKYRREGRKKRETFSLTPRPMILIEFLISKAAISPLSPLLSLIPPSPPHSPSSKRIISPLLAVESASERERKRRRIPIPIRERGERNECERVREKYQKKSDWLSCSEIHKK
jgi:hypothetical protein